MEKLIILTLFLVALVGCQPAGQKKVELKTDDDKTLYTVGTMFGNRLKNLELTEQELSILYLGLSDSSSGKKLAVDTNSYHAKVQAFFRGRMGKSTEKVKKVGTDYIAKFLSEPGAKKTASGLAYKVIKEGTGNTPKATDEVEVHYHGTLIDGTVFDSSVDRKKKVTFPLNKVIKGWTEGLQLIKTGGKVRLVIPSELAYGDHGAPPKIPGGATLVFDVELFQIKAPSPTPAAPPIAKKAPVKK